VIISPIINEVMIVKHLLAIVLAAVVLASPGCTPKGGDVVIPTADTDGFPEENVVGVKDEDESGTGVAFYVDVEVDPGGWPTGHIPALSRYPYGKIIGFTGPDNDYGVIVEAGETNLEELYAYLDALEEEGWIVTRTSTPSQFLSAWAARGTYKVDFDLLSDTRVLFTVKVAQPGVWPSFDEYPINIPPPEGFDIVDTVVRFFPDTAINEFVGSFDFTVMDMDWIAAMDYYRLLDGEGYYEPFDWKGKTYVCETIEEDFLVDGAGNMYCSFGIYLVD